jgi:hypothetical protein
MPPPAADTAPQSVQLTGDDAQAAPAILILAFVDAAGQDSLGRVLDHASVAAAVIKDRTVLQEPTESIPIPRIIIARARIEVMSACVA